MSEQDRDPLTQVDALVRAYLVKQSKSVDGQTGLARVRAALKPTVPPAPARRWFRLAWVTGLAAAVLLAFVSGWYLSPVRAGVRELVQEVKRMHNLPLARCYVVEVQRPVEDELDRVWKGGPTRQVRVWTRGDRFWVEMQHADAAPPFIWGRAADGALWAVLDDQRGVRLPLSQSPKVLRRIADFFTLHVDTLLGTVLEDCTLTDETTGTAPLTRVVVAKPRAERRRLWFAQITLEIDSEAKVLRRLEIVRHLQDHAQTKVIFTLVETRADDLAKYQLEGHLTKPPRIYEGKIEPAIRMELLSRWFGGRKEERAPKEAAAQPKQAEGVAVPFQDADGHTHTPLSQPEKKATVLFFVLPDCPISNAYAPEIQRICADYALKKIASFVVQVDPDLTAEQAKKHAQAYGLACPILLDPKQVLVKKTGVTVAPEVAVLTADGKVAYRGRIDNWYADLGKRRAEPTVRDLRAALEAILQGQAVPTPTTKAIGCFLPEPKP